MEKKRKKERIDTLLVERGLFETRQKARAAVMAGEVLADGAAVSKAGALVAAGCDLRVKRRARYVGRGGEKLAGALAAFGIAPAGKRALDVGASTGGFTHCLLEGGAASVHAVDVGYGQFATALRGDPRVTLAERTNIRHVSPGDAPHPFDLAVVDVSFISLELVLPVVKNLLAPGGEIIALVKPQFEVGRGRVGKGGVVRDRALHVEVLERLAAFCGGAGLAAVDVAASPLRGPKGNIEFFLLIVRDDETKRAPRPAGRQPKCTEAGSEQPEKMERKSVEQVKLRNGFPPSPKTTGASSEACGNDKPIQKKKKFDIGGAQGTSVTKEDIERVVASAHGESA